MNGLRLVWIGLTGLCRTYLGLFNDIGTRQSIERAYENMGLFS